jgi:glycosyltransferase involved in cell wall biosynthesis
MAGNGDMMESMVHLVAIKGISHRFHFTGFLKGKEVYEMLKSSDVYVMPSVSEPFGISPLEAMQVGVPAIISKQSGCAEILHNAIKLDYWDIDGWPTPLIQYILSGYVEIEKRRQTEVDGITWEQAGEKLKLFIIIVPPIKLTVKQPYTHSFNHHHL